MKVFDLFAGIGGFSVGLQRAGMHVAGQCEIDPFCLAVLAKHFPDAWRHEDVRTLNQGIIEEHCGRIDLLCGGFPCQDVSDAGLRRGIKARRSGLWSQFFRLIKEVSPRWVIIENVDGLRRRWLGDVLGDVAACGYDAEWRVFGACDVGAPHVRERIFILAHAPGVRLSCNEAADQIGRQSLLEKVERSAGSREAFSGNLGRSGKRLPHAGLLRMDDGLPSELDVRRVASLGNAIVPQLTELIGNAIMEAAA